MRGFSFAALCALFILALAGCSGEAAAEHEAGHSEGIAIAWIDPTTLAVEATGFAPEQTVLVSVDVAGEQSDRRQDGGSLVQVSQQSRQQVAVSAIADSSGTVIHQMSIQASPGASVTVTVDDLSGLTRTAATTVPAP